MTANSLAILLIYRKFRTLNGRSLTGNETNGSPGRDRFLVWLVLEQGISSESTVTMEVICRATLFAS